MTSTHPVTSPNLGGRTGDLDGNLNRVKRELRRIRFPVDFDAGAAREGNPMALLPALHYALLGFSRHVTSSLVDAGHDLQAKSDARFVENAWRALREAFGYNPALSPSQFLSPGFAERKLMLLHDAIELCKRRHNEHARRKRAEETAAAVSREGVPRVARGARETKRAETRKESPETKKGGSETESSPRKEPFFARGDPSARGDLPRAFAITRHEIVRKAEGGAGVLSKENKDFPPSSAARPEPPRDGSDAESDFEFFFERPSLVLEGARAPLRRSVDAPVEPWFARSSRAAKGDALETTEAATEAATLNAETSRGPSTAASTETAAATTEGVSLAAAKTRGGGFPDENAPPAGRTNASPTYSDDEIIGLMTQRFSKQNIQDTEDTEDIEDEASEPRKGQKDSFRKESREQKKKNADDEKDSFSSVETKEYLTASAAKAFLAAFETRTADAERRAAVAVDAARAAEAVASRAVAACQETVEQMLGERARGAQLAAALAEQTAKSLLLEKRVRALERGEQLRDGADVYGSKSGLSLGESAELKSSSRVSLATAKASASTKRFGLSADGDEPHPRFVADGGSVPFLVRRDPPSGARSPKPAPTETGAFIDFYSGVLGVDRAQLARER
jgi:hypothetical protein